MRFKKPDCVIGCAAGTWLTCTDEVSCTYVTPSQALIELIRARARNATTVASVEGGVRQWVQRNKQAGVDVPVSLGLGVPFDTCYPCQLAAGRSHFGRHVVTDSGLLNRGFLQFDCPGGELGPRMCGADELSLADNRTLTSSPCGCKPGLFRDAQGGCSVCTAGYRCLFGATMSNGVEQCPVDTYSVAGSSACTACGKQTGMCGPNQALTRCNGVGFQQQDSVCVDCNECVEISGGQTPGAKPCLHVV